MAQLDKYTRLKIASNVLDMTLSEMAEAWGVTVQTIRGVCDGRITSERISVHVDKTIKEGEDKFSAHLANRNLKTAAV